MKFYFVYAPPSGEGFTQEIKHCKFKSTAKRIAQQLYLAYKDQADKIHKEPAFLKKHCRLREVKD